MISPILVWRRTPFAFPGSTSAPPPVVAAVDEPAPAPAPVEVAAEDGGGGCVVVEEKCAGLDVEVEEVSGDLSFLNIFLILSILILCPGVSINQSTGFPRKI